MATAYRIPDTPWANAAPAEAARGTLKTVTMGDVRMPERSFIIVPDGNGSAACVELMSSRLGCGAELVYPTGRVAYSLGGDVQISLFFWCASMQYRPWLAIPCTAPLARQASLGHCRPRARQRLYIRRCPMDEQTLRHLAREVEIGKLSRRRFTQILVGLGPDGAHGRPGPGDGRPRHAQPKEPVFTPTSGVGVAPCACCGGRRRR